MLKKIAERLALGRTGWDPVPYWRERAKDPETRSVMWANLAYNELADRDEWAVIERALPERRDSVLDLGCGTGRMSARLAAAFRSYTGVDLDTMVAEAARRNPGLADRYVAATVDSYQYPTDAFDCVLSLACLAHACSKNSLPGAAGRLVGTIRRGGRLVLVEPFHTSGLLTRGCRVTPREVRQLFESLGMKTETHGGILFVPGRLVLSEQVFSRFPRATERAFEAGEVLARRYPALLSDYAVIVLSKPR